MGLKLKINDIVSANIVVKSLCSNCYDVRIEGVLKDDGSLDYYLLHINDGSGGSSTPEGITPTGTINLTNVNTTYDVTNYAYAKIVDNNLIASNIKKGVTILGITGTYQGTGTDTDTDTETECQHTNLYYVSNNDNATHTVKCVDCDETIRTEDCTDNGSGICSFCSQELTKSTETIINLYGFYGGSVTKHTYEGDVSVTWGTNGDAPRGHGVMYFNGEEIYNIGVEALEGLSVANDYNVTSDGDIPYGTTKTLTAGNEYTFYTYVTSELKCSHENLSYSRVSGTFTHTVTCEECGETIRTEYCTYDGGGSCQYCHETMDGDLPITTLIVYNSDGSLRGKLTTANPNPYLFFQLYDSGEVGITDGFPAESTGNYYNNTISFSYNGNPMAGLSVANDKNLTSTGDIVWTNNESDPSQGEGNKKTLTAGNTYVYFGYKNSDLTTSGDSSGGTTTSYACPSCGQTMSVCPNCGSKTCFNGACSNYIGDELYYLKPYCSVGCKQSQ